MYTYDDIDWFQETLVSLAILKIAYDNGVDLSHDNELAIDFYGSSDTGYTDSMYYFQEVLQNTVEIVEYLSGNDEDDLEDYRYWLKKAGHDLEWTESTTIYLLMDDRLSKPPDMFYPTSVNSNSWSTYFDVVHLEDEDNAVIVLFDYDNGEPNAVEALQYIFECLSTTKVEREDMKYAVAN